eukprot:458758_1
MLAGTTISFPCDKLPENEAMNLNRFLATATANSLRSSPPPRITPPAAKLCIVSRGSMPTIRREIPTFCIPSCIGHPVLKVALGTSCDTAPRISHVPYGGALF